MASKPVADVTAGPNREAIWVIATSVEGGRNALTCSQNEPVEPPAVDWAAAGAIPNPHAAATLTPASIRKR